MLVLFLLSVIESALATLSIYYYTRKASRRHRISTVQEAGVYLNSVYGKFFQKKFSFALYHIESSKFILYTFDMSSNHVFPIGECGEHQPDLHYYDVGKQTFLTLPSKPILDIANETIKFNDKREPLNLNFFDPNITISADKNILEFKQKQNHVVYNESQTRTICSTKEKGALFPVTMRAYKQFYGTPSTNTSTTEASVHRSLYFQCNVDGTIQLKRCPHGFTFSTKRNLCEG